MACPFCATGQGGLTRNLSTAEIVEQVRTAARSAAAGRLGSDGTGTGGPAGRLSNVVFMGMGEPLANVGPRPSTRRAPVDRAGPGRLRPLPPLDHRVDGRARAGDRVASPTAELDVTLAVSLHAPDDELRNTLVPVNTRWNVCARCWPRPTSYAATAPVAGTRSSTP